MAHTATPCPKCQDSMFPGYIPDMDATGIAQPKWYEGYPKKDFFRGIRFTYEQGLPVRAYRCATCGFLEFYADAQFIAD